MYVGWPSFLSLTSIEHIYLEILISISGGHCQPSWLYVAWKSPSHSVMRVFSAHWIQKQLICIKKMAIIIFRWAPLSLALATWLCVRVCLVLFLSTDVCDRHQRGIAIAKQNEKKKKRYIQDLLKMAPLLSFKQIFPFSLDACVAWFYFILTIACVHGRHHCITQYMKLIRLNCNKAEAWSINLFWFFWW